MEPSPTPVVGVSIFSPTSIGVPPGRPLPSEAEQAVMRRIIKLMPRVDQHADCKFLESLLGKPNGVSRFISYADASDFPVGSSVRSCVLDNNKYVTVITDGRGNPLSSSVLSPLEKLVQMETLMQTKLPENGRVVSLESRRQLRPHR